MTKYSFRAAVLALCSICGFSTANANLITVVNWNFQTPDVTGEPNKLLYNPSAVPGVGWTFNPASGITANDGAFLMENALDGSNVVSSNGQGAFIQNAEFNPEGPLSGSISQTLNGFNIGGSYVVRFMVEGRQNPVYGTNPLAVTLGGQTLTFTYNNTQTVEPIAGTTFYTYTSVPITISSTSASLVFTGTANPVGGDKTTFVDNVQVYSPGDNIGPAFGPDAPGTPVPEPGTWAAAALLVGGAAFARWRKRARIS